MSRHDPGSTGPRALYQRLADSLDPATAGRLRAARREALAGPAPAPRRGWTLPAGAFAAAVLAAGLAWWLPGAPTAPTAGVATAPDAAEIDALVVEEDPEFYAWLADAPVATRRGRP